MTCEYLSPTDVQRDYGFSREHLAQLRFTAKGPRYYNPTPKKILYLRADIDEWIQASARYGTAQAS